MGMGETMRIDRDVPIPLYYQIAEQIRERVRTGELLPGERIPAERELTQLFDVSRMTVHQAITYLVQLGVLTVRRGAGTYVAEPKLTHDTLRVVGFEEEVARQGGHVSSIVLEQTVLAASDAERSFLNLSRGDEVYRIVRLRQAWDTPLLLETSNIPCALCPGLIDFDFSSRSLYSVLEEEYGITLFTSDQYFEASAATDYQADLFGIETGNPMILFDGVTYAAGDVPVEYCRAVYRGDKFQFYSRGNRSDESGSLYLRLATEKGMVH